MHARASEGSHRGRPGRSFGCPMLPALPARRAPGRGLGASLVTAAGPRAPSRAVRTLTFWLRPEFVLRVVSRFQKVAGFDRSVALASSALTATIPLLVVASAVASQ